MAVTTASPGPYAPASAILDLIARYRSRGMTTPFTAEVLGRAGVSDSLVPRVLQALRVLELIDDAGKPTETFEGLRRATEKEFKETLAAWISGAYADVLTFVDPTANESDIRDAFRAYNPVGQQSRMVSLFLGLCSAAGLRTMEQTKETKPRPQARKQPANPVTPMRRQSPAMGKTLASVGYPPLPPALLGLLSSLPTPGNSWTTSQCESFLTTFGTVVKFCFPIDDEQERDDE